MKTYIVAFAAILLCAAAAQAQIDNNRYHASVLGGWSGHPGLDLGTARPGVDDSFNLGARAGVNLNGISCNRKTNRNLADSDRFPSRQIPIPTCRKRLSRNRELSGFRQSLLRWRESATGLRAELHGYRV